MKTRLIPALAALLALAAGCAAAVPAPAPPSDSAAPAKERGAVIVALDSSAEPEAGFDPAFGWGAGEHVHEPLIQSTLTVTDQELKIKNDLATGFQASEDGLTWSVTLRDGVRFSDGEPLTAEDVAFTYNTLKEVSSVTDLTMLERAEATDEKTVVFTLNRPFSIWPYTMAQIGILPRHAYDPATYGANPVGSGRYLLRQWDKGQQVILEANPDYYGEAPKMKRVTVLFLAEDAAFLAAKSGQADLCDTSASYAGETVDGYELLSFESVDNRGLNLPAVPAGEQTAAGVPLGNDLTADPAVRQAINLGIDREELIENVLSGHGTPAYSVCDGLPWSSPALRVECDPDGARKLLDEAGWVPGEDGVRQRGGVRASMRLLYPVGDSVRQALATALGLQLSALGIEASPEGVGWDTAYARALSEPMVWGWGAHTPMELYNLYHTDPQTGLARYSPYRNEEADRIMDDALACSDVEESYRLWQRVQWDGQGGGVAADAPWVWLVNVNHLYWARQDLQVARQKIHPHGHGWSILNNVDQWTWQ